MFDTPPAILYFLKNCSPPHHSIVFSLCQVHLIQLGVTFDTCSCIICTRQIVKKCLLWLYHIIPHSVHVTFDTCCCIIVLCIIGHMWVYHSVLWKNLWKTLWKSICVDFWALYHMYLTFDSMLAKTTVTADI